MGTKRHVGCGGAAALAGLLLITATAAAQDAKTLAELKRWHDKLAESNAVISIQDGRQARAQLKTWGLSVNDLELEHRGWLLRVEIVAALAVGDARRAAEWLPDLQLDFPDVRATLRAAWLVAGATGDAELAKRSLEKLRAQGAAESTAVSKRLRRLRMIGRPGPDVAVTTESGQTVALRRRNGVVLVLDFWDHRDKPGDKQVEALRGLYEALAGVGKVEFLGVNADGPAEVEAAKKFAADSGYTWPQHYERRTSGAPLILQLRIDQLFGVRSLSG